MDGRRCSMARPGSSIGYVTIYPRPRRCGGRDDIERINVGCSLVFLALVLGQTTRKDKNISGTTSMVVPVHGNHE